jgi:hypothetical protein
MGNLTDAIGSASSAVANLSMGVTMFSTGWQTMMEEDASAMDKLTGAMSMA